ncbi:MAG: hypothetical protein LUD47_03825 [Clostridia bacterium]|nr:hypothetical protein [Clostridia bacterium]
MNDENREDETEQGEKTIEPHEDVKLELKPLSQNSFAAFWQRLYRAWLGVWYGFTAKHEKAGKIIYLIVFFLAFSIGVTIWQYIVMAFLPLAFESMNNGAFGWTPFELLGEGCTLIGDERGLGYFIAYEIAVFTAQCINFPLQRNITYRSHGNPWFQAMWYFIAWVIISFICGALWGLCHCVCDYWGLHNFIQAIIETIITGIISMIVFFFIFLLIFPNVDKFEKAKKEKLEKKRAALDADSENRRKQAACEKAGLVAIKAEETRRVFYAEGEIRNLKSLAEAKIATYYSLEREFKQIESGEKKQSEKKPVTAETVEKARREAVEAVIKRDRGVPFQQAILDEIKAAREARASESAGH